MVGFGVLALEYANPAEYINKNRAVGLLSTALDIHGSPARTRTADPMVNSHLLCQLSYWGSLTAPNNNKELSEVKAKTRLCRVFDVGVHD